MLEIKALNSTHLAMVSMIERAAYPLPWSDSMLESSLTKDQVWGVFDRDVLLGYAIVSYVLDEAHLLNICIDPQHAAKGLGRRLLGYVIKESIARSSVMIFLEVRASNSVAINLYFSEGFNEVGIRPNYYPALGGGKEDAVLMTMELRVHTKV